MKLPRCKVFVLLVAQLFFASCKEDTETDPVTPAPVTGQQDDLPPEDTSTPSLTIAWEENAVKMSHEVYSAEYGRAHRVKGDTVLLTCHLGLKEMNGTILPSEEALTAAIPGLRLRRL